MTAATIMMTTKAPSIRYKLAGGAAVGGGAVGFDEFWKLVDYDDCARRFVPFREFFEEFNPAFDGEFCEAFVFQVEAHSLF
jgi:hypothetical protein